MPRKFHKNYPESSCCKFLHYTEMHSFLYTLFNARLVKSNVSPFAAADSPSHTNTALTAGGATSIANRSTFIYLGNEEEGICITLIYLYTVVNSLGVIGG